MNEVSRQLQEVLFSSVCGIAVASIDADGEAIHIEARCTAAGAACPVCGTRSEKVHSSYLRFPTDLPSAGQHVVLALRVRRYVCTHGRVRAGRSWSRCLG